MPSVAQRVTNGQRACVCGLVIAGVTMKAACRVAGVPQRTLREFLPPWWGGHKGGPAGRPRKWKDADLAAMKLAWLAGEGSRSIGLRFGLHESAVRRIAQREGWPKRRAGRVVTADHVPVRMMKPAQRHLYNKLRSVLPREQAYAEAMR